MLNVTLITVGKLKAKYLKDAVAEYSKRLGKYISLNICELNDGPDMETEAARILPHLKDDGYVVTLEIEGIELDSPSFAKKIDELMTYGTSRIIFIIGGSNGLADSITDRADLHLSFSKMTFPHQLMRVIFLEQLYRAFKIITREPYHK